jgi:hypothetical protein
MGTAKGSNTQKTLWGKRRKSQLKTQKRIDANQMVLKKLNKGYDNTIFSSGYQNEGLEK